MSFTSFAFLLFAAATVLLYYLVPKRGQWVVLLVASTLFYAAAGGWYLPFILVTILSTFFLARIIAARAARDEAYIAAHKADLPKEERKAADLMSKLDIDFSILLDNVTIARSRKHITKYYDTSEIGQFPTRLKPVSYYCDIARKQDVLKLKYGQRK